jgi:hypothetical protein
VKTISSSRKLVIATLLGAVAFVSTGFLPSPVDKMLSVFQALTYALGSLIIAIGGATYVSVINGVLLSILRIGYFPFSLIFSVTYGLLVDGFFRVFRVKEKEHVDQSKLIISLVFATAIIGIASMYATTLMGMLPMLPTLYLAIIVIGAINGGVAGYLTTLVWNRILKRQV